MLANNSTFRLIEEVQRRGVKLKEVGRHPRKLICLQDMFLKSGQVCRCSETVRSVRYAQLQEPFTGSYVNGAGVC